MTKVSYRVSQKTHCPNCPFAKLGSRAYGLPLPVKQPTGNGRPHTFKPSFAKRQFRKCVCRDTLYIWLCPYTTMLTQSCQPPRSEHIAMKSLRWPRNAYHSPYYTVLDRGGNSAIDSGINRKPKEWVAQPRPQTHLPPLPTDRTERKPQCIKIPMHCRCFLCMWTMCSNSCKCCKVRKIYLCTETPVQNVRLNRVYRSLMCMNLWPGPSHNVTATILTLE